MGIKIWLAKAAAVILAVLSAQGAQAVLIFDGGPAVGAGTYIGSYDVTQGDAAVFMHLIPAGEIFFTDFWVFDVDPTATATMSANYTGALPIDNFMGSLFADNGGTTCSATIGDACTVIDKGALLDSDSGTAWELAAPLFVGRYILEVSGTTTADLSGLYTGQLGVVYVPEPASVALLSLGLLGLGLAFRRRTKAFANRA